MTVTDIVPNVLSLPAATKCTPRTLPNWRSVMQLRSALLAYDALATAAETVVTAASCSNSTATNCSAVVAALRDATAPITREIALGQVRCSLLAL
jgi:hypothetical protein